MKKPNAGLSLLALTLIFMGCAGRQVKIDRAHQTVKKGGISMAANWIKDKDKKFDVNLTIKNESSKSRIIMLGGIGCYRGASVGVLKHTFFNTGERTIDFRPSETKTFNMVCNYSGPAKGAFRIVVEKVFDNPMSDGKTTGKIVAENIEWKQSNLKK